MFIRRVPHKNRKNHKEYYTYKLVESIRTERGPRQRDIVNLGVGFDVPKDTWKDLSNCIEEIITGQKSFFDYPKAIRNLARRYARKIIREHASVIAEREDSAPDHETIDINSLEDEEVRTVGAEYVVYETVKELGIDRKLRKLGLDRYQLAASLGVIAGRMIVPGSERATHYWLRNASALDELMGVDFSTLSLDRVYKVSDWLLKHKQSLEEHLRRTEGQLLP